MNQEKDRIAAFLNSLSSAVVNAIKSGSADEKKRFILSLKAMESEMPAVSEDTAEAKEFLRALIGLLEGSPPGGEGLSEPYAGYYRAILAMALGEKGRRAEAGADAEVREFLTELSATVVLVLRRGTEEDKEALAKKLREIHKGMAAGKKDAALFVLALASIIEGNPVDPEALPEQYADFYRKVKDEQAKLA